MMMMMTCISSLSAATTKGPVSPSFLPNACPIWGYLIIAILLVVLLLDNWTEVEGSVVDQVGCVLGEVEYHKVEIQAHHTACKTSHSRCFRIPDPVHIQPPPYLSVWTSLSGTLSLWTIIQKEWWTGCYATGRKKREGIPIRSQTFCGDSWESLVGRSWSTRLWMQTSPESDTPRTKPLCAILVRLPSFLCRISDSDSESDSLPLAQIPALLDCKGVYKPARQQQKPICGSPPRVELRGERVADLPCNNKRQQNSNHPFLPPSSTFIEFPDSFTSCLPAHSSFMRHPSSLPQPFSLSLLLLSSSAFSSSTALSKSRSPSNPKQLWGRLLMNFIFPFYILELLSESVSVWWQSHHLKDHCATLNPKKP